MKFLKRPAALLLSLLMVVLMIPTSALAATTDGITAASTGTLNITKPGSGSTFAVYRLFDMLAPIGAHAFTYTPTNAYTSFFSSSSAPTAATISKYNTSDLEAFIASLQSFKTDANRQGSPVTANTQSGNIYTATFSSLPIGYYLVTETATTGARVASKDFLVSVPQGTTDGSGVTTWSYNVTANCKDDTVTFDKTIVKDSNDFVTTDLTGATRNIDDIVDYRLDADVPQYDPSATNITFQMTDSISKGLTYNDRSVKVYGVDKSNNSTLLTTGYTVNGPVATSTFTANDLDDTIVTNGKTITIDFDYGTIKSYSKIKVLYSATLNNEAVIGSAGNPNEAFLTYTNNPKTKTKYKTDHYKPYVYTFGIDILKINTKDSGAANPDGLKGAVFALYDQPRDKTSTDDQRKPLAVYTYVKNDSGTLEVQKLSGTATVTTGTDGKAYFVGMDEGKYYIKEVTAPDGFSLLPGEVEAVIEATKDAQTPPQPTGDFTFKYRLNPTDSYTLPTQDNYTYTDDTKTVKVLATFKILDDHGFTLPGTGGIGTTIFTVIGIAILLLGGCMAFVYTRKKKHSAKH